MGRAQQCANGHEAELLQFAPHGSFTTQNRWDARCGCHGLGGHESPAISHPTLTLPTKRSPALLQSFSRNLKTERTMVARYTIMNRTEFSEKLTEMKQIVEQLLRQVERGVKGF
jgi:hypothetical protein